MVCSSTEHYVQFGVADDVLGHGTQVLLAAIPVWVVSSFVSDIDEIDVGLVCPHHECVADQFCSRFALNHLQHFESDLVVRNFVLQVLFDLSLNLSGVDAILLACNNDNCVLWLHDSQNHVQSFHTLLGAIEAACVLVRSFGLVLTIPVILNDEYRARGLKW